MKTTLSTMVTWASMMKWRKAHLLLDAHSDASLSTIFPSPDLLETSVDLQEIKTALLLALVQALELVLLPQKLVEVALI